MPDQGAGGEGDQMISMVVLHESSPRQALHTANEETFTNAPIGVSWTKPSMHPPKPTTNVRHYTHNSVPEQSSLVYS